VITPDKIKEWIGEVEERPESAALIIQQIANRLLELTRQVEAIRAENIALKSGVRVEEYERYIAHLEYQLELLKRQFGGEVPVSDDLPPADQPPVEIPHVLLYDPGGRVLHFPISDDALVNGGQLVQVDGDLTPTDDPPRLMVVPSTEELLFVFVSGRVASLPVSELSPLPQEGQPSWSDAPVPYEPHAGDTLACITPISRMALSGYFVQISRRGYVKKIRIAMAKSILANHYIGKGVDMPTDQTLEVLLSNQDDRLVLVSHQGYLLCLETEMVSPAVEEAMRLGSSDHLVSAFIARPGQGYLVMTQLGKLIYRLGNTLETTPTLKRKGQAVFSARRREQGVRVVAAGVVREDDWGLALHQDGRLTVHAMRDVLGAGTLPVDGVLLAFTIFPAPAIGTSATEA
jgi:hypothetical protein